MTFAFFFFYLAYVIIKTITYVRWLLYFVCVCVCESIEKIYIYTDVEVATKKILLKSNSAAHEEANFSFLKPSNYCKHKHYSSVF